jgi:type VI secretion system protein ImpF
MAMAGISPRDRLQPSLLDRLRSDADERGYSEARLRESVKRDLAWLFNTSNFASVQDLSAHPGVARSVVNFGLPSLSGLAASGVKTAELQEAFRRAILDFEPRLLRSSVRVHLEKTETEMSHNALVFTISADLWAQPLPLHVLLRTHVDLETGKVEVVEGSGGSRTA